MKAFFLLALNLLFANCYSQWIQTSGPYGGDVSSLLYTDTALYAGCTDYGGLFKSNDDGDTWERIGSSIPGFNPDVRAIVLRNGILFAATLDGILKSTDDGNIWSVSWGSSSINYLAQNKEYLFAGSSGVIRSSNDGVSWENVTSGLKDYVTQVKVYNENVYAGTEDGLFISPNNGSNWSLISEGLPIQYINDFIVRGDTLYVATNFGGIYLSTNNGSNWIKIGLKFLNQALVLEYFQDKLYAGFFGIGIYSSTDHGATWEELNNGLDDHSITNCMIFGQDFFLAGFLGPGIYKSTNSGESWFNSSNGLSATRISSLVNCDRGILAGSKKGIYLTTDSGDSWENSSTNLNCTYISSLANNGNVIFAGTSGGCGLMKSTDDGTSWFSSNNGLQPFSSVNGITSNNEFDFVATSAGVFKSTNNGNLWNPVNGLPSEYFTTIKIIDSLIFASSNSLLYKSTNFGISWTPSSIGLPQFTVYKGIESFQDRIIVATLNGIFISGNYGISWYGSSNGLSSNITFAIIRQGNFLITSTFEGNHYSSNAGQNWLPLRNGLSSITECFLSKDTNVYAGTMGDAVYKLDFNSVGINFTGNILPQQFLLKQNYPNPFNPETIIKFELSEFNHVSLKVFDVLGNEIVTLVNQKLSPGSYEFTFNGRGVSSGIYFYTLKTMNQTETKKMLLVK